MFLEVGWELWRCLLLQGVGEEFLSDPERNFLSRFVTYFSAKARSWFAGFFFGAFTSVWTSIFDQHS